jgi:hypothetical protein
MSKYRRMSTTAGWRGNRSPAYKRSRKMTTSLSRGRGTVSRPGARPAPTMRFFTREPTLVLSIWLRPNVYVFGISFATASRLLFGAMYAIYVRSRNKEVGGEGNLMTVPSELSHVVEAERSRRVGQPKGESPFYSASAPIITLVTDKITFLPRRQPLTMVKFPKGSTRLFLGSASVWAVRGSSEARFLPSEELVVSSAHLEDGTALTDEGLLLGKMALGSFVHARPG